LRLDRFSSASFDRGAPRWKEALWLLAGALLLASWLPGSGWRRRLLRGFGAQIAPGVVIKPGVRVKFPWRLTVGDHSWIGEDVWIDNLAPVTIGAHACLSQGAYLCTGSHDWASKCFGLITQPIVIENHAWVGARANMAPGSTLGAGAVLAMGSLGKGQMAPWTIYAGTPATATGVRPTQGEVS
jgi:putative colanic acid biosynthesis acetyltransferase WcaF